MNNRELIATGFLIMCLGLLWGSLSFSKPAVVQSELDCGLEPVEACYEAQKIVTNSCEIPCWCLRVSEGKSVQWEDGSVTWQPTVNPNEVKIESTQKYWVDKGVEF